MQIPVAATSRSYCLFAIPRDSFLDRIQWEVSWQQVNLCNRKNSSRPHITRSLFLCDCNRDSMLASAKSTRMPRARDARWHRLILAKNERLLPSGWKSASKSRGFSMKRRESQLTRSQWEMGWCSMFLWPDIWPPNHIQAFVCLLIIMGGVIIAIIQPCVAMIRLKNELEAWHLAASWRRSLASSDGRSRLQYLMALFECDTQSMAHFSHDLSAIVFATRGQIRNNFIGNEFFDSFSEKENECI